MLFECPERLFDKFPPVRQEKHLLNALLPLKQLDKRHGDSRFPCAGGQNHEELPKASLDALGDGFVGFDLVSAVDDFRAWHDAGQRFPELVQVSEPEKVLLGEKAADFSRRPHLPVPEPDFVTVGEEDEGIPSRVRQDGISVIGGLPFAFQGMTAGSLGLDDGQNLAQMIDEGVVGELVFCLVGCLRVLERRGGHQILLNQTPAANRPTGSSELEVDFFLARLLLWFHEKAATFQNAAGHRHLTDHGTLMPPQNERVVMLHPPRGNARLRRFVPGPGSGGAPRREGRYPVPRRSIERPFRRLCSPFHTKGFSRWSGVARNKATRNRH